MLPFPINERLPWLIAFLVGSCGLIAVTAIWIFTEWGEPEWRKYQEIELSEMKKNLEKQLPTLENPKWGDPAQARIVRMSIENLRKPDYQIKQIILKGYGRWEEGTTGKPVDRCMSCHIDEDKLTKQHPYTKDYFPFDVYGCTVCHGGVGRVLKKEGAHEGMMKNRKEMMKRIEKPEEMVALWTKMAELSLDEKDTAFDFRDFSAAGEKLVYIGSYACLNCHRKLTPRHIEFWGRKKFKTWEKVEEAKDYNEGDENYQKKCMKCHTTGYDEKTGEYSEENVMCEACHGPGEMFAKFMKEGKLAEAAKVTHDVFSYKVCGRCHAPRRHEMREAMLVAIKEREEKKELTDWLASSFGEESDDLLSTDNTAGGAGAGEMEGLQGLEIVADSLGAMLDDFHSLLPEQQKESVQTAREAPSGGERRPHPLKVKVGALQEAPVASLEQARADTSEKLFSSKDVY